MAGTIPGVAYRNRATQRSLAAHVVPPTRASAFSPTPGVSAYNPTAPAGRKDTLHAVTQALATSAMIATLFAAAPAWATSDINPMRDTKNDLFPSLIAMGVVFTFASPWIFASMRGAIKERDPMGIFVGALGMSIAPACFVATMLM